MGGGRLRRQDATFTVGGRGRAARPKKIELTFPPASIADPEPEPLYTPPLERKPLRGSVPVNRQPMRGEENPLWLNVVPNEPSAAL
jgi:hypothetical protein